MHAFDTQTDRQTDRQLSPDYRQPCIQCRAVKLFTRKFIPKMT